MIHQRQSLHNIEELMKLNTSANTFILLIENISLIVMLIQNSCDYKTQILLLYVGLIFGKHWCNAL